MYSENVSKVIKNIQNSITLRKGSKPLFKVMQMQAGKNGGMAQSKVSGRAKVDNRQTKTPGIKGKREQAKSQSPKSGQKVKNWEAEKAALNAKRDEELDATAGTAHYAVGQGRGRGLYIHEGVRNRCSGGRRASGNWERQEWLGLLQVSSGWNGNNMKAGGMARLTVTEL